MIRRPPRSTLFPYTSSSDLSLHLGRSPDLHHLFLDLVHPVDAVMDVLPDRKSTRLNSSHLVISYAVFCLKKKTYTTLTLAPHSIAMRAVFMSTTYNPYPDTT